MAAPWVVPRKRRYRGQPEMLRILLTAVDRHPGDAVADAALR